MGVSREQLPTWDHIQIVTAQLARLPRLDDEPVGTGICSGEGGMLPEEQIENSRYLYELASARFGWSPDVLRRSGRSTSRAGREHRPGPAGTFPATR